jgi:hypothetical protein
LGIGVGELGLRHEDFGGDGPYRAHFVVRAGDDLAPRGDLEPLADIAVPAYALLTVISRGMET